MTSDQLIEEGRKLERPCVFLRPKGRTPVAAVWYERDRDDFEATEHCVLTIDARQVPGLPSSVKGYLSIFTDDENCVGGRVEITRSWPKRARTGTKLYAHPASVLPPIDAVIARGSEAVGKWLRSLGWKREWRYNDNFKGAAVVREYERVWWKEYPVYLESDVYAALGGWHFPSSANDWHELLADKLVVFTVGSGEPRVEAWRTRNGRFRVIQRIT